MFLIQCLLTAIVVIMIAGIAMILRDIDRIIQNQAHLIAQKEKHYESLLGEYSEGALFALAHDLKSLAEFARHAKQGRIPSLRYDDWYATKEDIARWEHAEIMEAASR